MPYYCLKQIDPPIVERIFPLSMNFCRFAVELPATALQPFLLSAVY